MSHSEIRRIALSKRLCAVAELVRKDRLICDVGTDHALLPCYLVQCGAQRVIASDVNDGPLAAARETISRYDGFDKKITTVKSDGLRDIDFAEDIVIAGMGGELIARIISECTFITADTNLVLQPMTKAEILRRELYRLGYETVSEKAVFDGGKAYAVIQARFTGKKEEISPAFSYTGKIKDKRYIEKQAQALIKAADSCVRADPVRAEALRLTAREIKAYGETL